MISLESIRKEFGIKEQYIDNGTYGFEFKNLKDLIRATELIPMEMKYYDEDEDPVTEIRIIINPEDEYYAIHIDES